MIFRNPRLAKDHLPVARVNIHTQKTLTLSTCSLNAVESTSVRELTQSHVNLLRLPKADTNLIPTMNQTGNRNSIIEWVKNLKRNTLSSESVNEINDDLSVSESRSPSRSSFQSGGFSHQPIPFPTSPTKERAIPSSSPHNSSGIGGSSDFLRPILGHKSRSTNNVNNARSDTLSLSFSNQDSSVGLRQRRDSFLQNNPLVDENSKYFGVPLEDAISQAAAKISILGSESGNEADEDVLHYGRIPIVVAKCGVYLKNNGLNVEGIFRVGGSSKRIKELQIIFNTPPEFGKRLNWDGYTVHDAASVLRRYLNALPEPLIPLELYEEFRDPLRSRVRIIKYLKYKADHSSKTVRTGKQHAAVTSTSYPSPTNIPTSPFIEPSSEASKTQTDKSSTMENLALNDSKADIQPEDITSTAANENSISSRSKSPKKPRSYKSLTRDVYGAIDEYKSLVDELPSLSKQLLFYILDLLAMVQSFSSENLMSARNLAAIFQPSILSHPSHDMDPVEYALSQSVVEFLISYSYKLLPNNESRPEASSSASLQSAKVEARSHVQSKRQHSKSLSTPNHDIDFVGFPSNVKSPQSFALSDTDHDFVSASSEDEIDYDKRFLHNWPSLTASRSNQNDASPDLKVVAEPAKSQNVPSVILDDAR
ncbi:hypothetical protein OXX59_007046 [Metschnikowia pulcherrima]